MHRLAVNRDERVAVGASLYRPGHITQRMLIPTLRGIVPRQEKENQERRLTLELEVARSYCDDLKEWTFIRPVIYAETHVLDLAAGTPRERREDCNGRRPADQK